jgi:hypothetical protein
MVKEALVREVIEATEKLLKELDERQFDVKVAVWLYYPEENQWNLLLAIPLYDRLGPKKTYAEIQSVLNSSPDIQKQIRLTDISVTSPGDSFVELLRAGTRKVKEPHMWSLSGTAREASMAEGIFVHRI